MMRVTFAVFSLFAALLLGAAETARSRPACELCTDSRSIACPSCEGKKTVFETCPACDGEGARDCLFCTGQIAALARHLEKPKPGTLRCQNRVCNGGEVRWDVAGQEDRCRVCSGRGTFDCRFCKGRKVDCICCDGKKKNEAACRTCRSTGSIPCPLCAVDPNSAECAACRGAAAEDCPRCQGEGKAWAKCAACDGKNTATCLECLGTDRVACGKCGGTGVMRTKLVDRNRNTQGIGGKKKHDTCAGRGTEKCGACTSGRAACWAAKVFTFAHADGRQSLPCLHCVGTGKVRCDGCAAGGSRALETAAGVLAAKGRRTEAQRLYEAALDRAEHWYGARLVEAKADGERARLQREREEDLSRLRKALSETKA